ncbi:DUF1642 domain-containing protein [Streptococcus suis]|uniref:DUF1642 domain-containing protein n=1 Tax=Streptococcus suis TaxID=1307 RepID=UPI0005CDA38D|nr:DUF1642 domain-containing protein [Streptococcus suis]NQH31069.1 DUF1642 domain-containing protein [Streptococcus suis]NQP27529.1 DUF1642 domain-containing protein [Streptococcus suis]NQP38565.1 DUF1642 domain-containing protein [Streptococcus suis]CYU77321.1 phage protein [Streptococcus suis]
MNKQEAKQKLHNIAFAKMNTRPDDLKLADVMQVIDQIDEPQKVVVPKFVAEWLKEYRHAHTLLKVLNAAENERIIPSTVNDWILDNQRDFVVAWYDGYEIEKEQLYTVEIPNPNRTTEPIIYLSRDEGGKIFLNNWFLHVSQNWKNQPHAQLTESEIKQDFEWAWQFAKEVGDD